MPVEALDFSRQLYEVRCAPLPSSSLNGKVRAWPNVPLDQQTCFSWRTQACVRLAFSRPTNHLPQEVQDAAEQFKEIIKLAVTSPDNIPIQVLTRRTPKLTKLFPWFASRPVVAPSFWPWLRKADEEIMDFSKHTFELFPDYIKRAMAIRKEGWFLDKDKKGKPKPIESAQNVPDPLAIWKFPAVLRFSDCREYLAHVLGGHAYEHEDDMANLVRNFNGTHKCEIFPDVTG